MKTAIATVLLTGALSASAQKIEDVKIPMTQELIQSIQRFVITNTALCAKRDIKEQACSKIIEDKTKSFRKHANDVCREYPKEAVPCIQYGLNLLMNADSRQNIISLNSKDV